MTPKIIVLDDDPTGSQTVHSCLLLTRWDVETLRRGLADSSPLMFVLTNTRAMSPKQAADVTRKACRNLKQALIGFTGPWLVVSRSDSTLRGHYPVETDVMADELGPFDAHFMTPEFFEGGRITRDAIHYVVRDGIETPAHLTEFAQDSVFGYSASYLPDYVEEKTDGRIPADSVELFGPVDPPDEVTRRLRSLAGNQCCAVSAENQRELNQVADLLLQVAAQGKRFLFRSAASLLTSLAKLPAQPVPPEEMAAYVPDQRPGLVLVGSHVPMSTRQLQRLLLVRGVESPGGNLVPIELDVVRLPDTDGTVAADLSFHLAQAHDAGKDVILFTSRTEREFDSAQARLDFGNEVSRVLMAVVASAPKTLGFILSKGGITSNDVLSSGLSLRAVRVVGQIHPGCSVVVTPEDHRHGSIPVVIFPGNVGNDDSLTVVYDRLTGRD